MYIKSVSFIVHCVKFQQQTALSSSADFSYSQPQTVNEKHSFNKSCELSCAIAEVNSMSNEFTDLVKVD